MTRPARTRRQGVAIAISVAVHVVIFLGLVFAIPRLAPPSAPAAIDVQIVRSPGLEKPPAGGSAQVKATHANASQRHTPQQNSSAAEEAPRASPESSPATDKPVEQPGRDAAIVAALRASVGCRHAGLVRLSPDEQRACDRIARADRVGIGAAHFGVEPEKQAVFDTAAKRDSILQQPFLSAKPTKGCKPRVTESDAETGGGRAEQDWTTSVACAIPF